MKLAPISSCRRSGSTLITDALIGSVQAGETSPFGNLA